MSCRKKTCIRGKCWVHIWGQDRGMCHSVMVLSFSITLFPYLLPRLWQKSRHTRKGNERTLDLKTTKKLAEPFKMERFMKGDQTNDTEVHRGFKYTWMYFSTGTIWPHQVRGSHTSSVRIKYACFTLPNLKRLCEDFAYGPLWRVSTCRWDNYVNEEICLCSQWNSIYRYWNWSSVRLLHVMQYYPEFFF